jgi:aryl-alcohol dehydrogenase-like predicted oxidoreductase
MRWLGNTKRKVGLLSLGGQPIFESEDEEDHADAVEIIHEALDEGVNYIDTAPAYGPKQSERTVGVVVGDGRRDEFYLATKCDKRRYKSAWKQINESIERLGDTPDCIQVHHLDHMWEVDHIFDKQKGAMKALLRAQKEGLCKFLGITGHSDPTVLLEALKRHPFDTVLGAVNIADPYAYSFQSRLIPYCKQHGIGFIAMKVCAGGAIFKKDRIYSMQECLDYVWSIPGVSTAIVGVTNIDQLRRNVEIAEEHEALSDERMQELEQLVEPYAAKALFFRKHHDWDDRPDDPEFVL